MSLLFLVGIYLVIASLMVVAVDQLVGIIYGASRPDTPPLSRIASARPIQRDVED
jgi:hypothetical protein